MEVLHNKKILLGITGGIAAYKCPELVRLLVKAGAEVRVIMTAAAADFVTAGTLSVVSRNLVITGFFDNNSNWNNHVKMGEWADLLLIAPLTANTLSGMATGRCDNVLLATYLSARSAVMVAPAMDLDMYAHATVKDNLQKLKEHGVTVLPAAHGELASGLTGEGRMPEPSEIVEAVRGFFAAKLPLSGKKALVNAGPTYEPIDPVRFIGNYSSGKTGLAIAERLAALGADVTLVLGPCGIKASPAVRVIPVSTAQEMLDAMLPLFPGSDIVVCAAAVADYRPSTTGTSKLKKSGANLQLELSPTSDILATLGAAKKNQCLVGFALESDNLIAYAKEKLDRKNLDIVVANEATGEYRAIGGDRSRVTIIDRHNNMVNFELNDKTAIAAGIVDHIIKYISG